MVATDKSERTQMLYSLHVHRLGEFLPRKHYTNYTEQDMMSYRTMLADKYAPYNVHNQMLDVMTFLKWHLRTEGKPECMKWYKTNEQRKKVVKKLNPKEVLLPEEIKKLVTAAGSRRNKAIIFCLWETGCRIEEFLNIHVGDVEFGESVDSIWINKGKTREAERQVLGYLAEKPATNTEIYKKLQKVAYRESIFKALKKLKEADLIKREFKEKEGYKYSLNFKELKVGKLVLLAQK